MHTTSAALLLLLLFLTPPSTSAAPPPTTNFSFSTFNDDALLLSAPDSASVESNGSLLLKATAAGSFAAVLYKSPVAIFNQTAASVGSFAAELTFETYSINGTLALTVLPSLRPVEALDLETARAALSIECGTIMPWPESNYGDGAGPAELNSGVTVYVKKELIIAQNLVKLYDPGSMPSACAVASPSQHLHHLVIAYDSDAQNILVGSRFCMSPLNTVISFLAPDLSSDGLFSGSPYVGLVAGSESYYRILNWSFSANASGAIASLTAKANGAGGDSSDSGAGGDISKRTKIVIAIAGVLIGSLLLVPLALCFCANARRRRTAAGGGGGYVSKGIQAATARRFGVAAGNGVAIEIQKPVRFSAATDTPLSLVPPAPLGDERDTRPLTRNPSYASSTAASWLPPVAPR